VGDDLVNALLQINNELDCRDGYRLSIHLCGGLLHVFSGIAQVASRLLSGVRQRTCLASCLDGLESRYIHTRLLSFGHPSSYLLFSQYGVLLSRTFSSWLRQYVACGVPYGHYT
jgi:hypothetical protein